MDGETIQQMVGGKEDGKTLVESPTQGEDGDLHQRAAAGMSVLTKEIMGGKPLPKQGDGGLVLVKEAMAALGVVLRSPQKRRRQDGVPHLLLDPMVAALGVVLTSRQTERRLDGVPQLLLNPTVVAAGGVGVQVQVGIRDLTIRREIKGRSGLLIYKCTIRRHSVLELLWD